MQTKMPCDKRWSMRARQAAVAFTVLVLPVGCSSTGQGTSSGGGQSSTGGKTSAGGGVTEGGGGASAGTGGGGETGAGAGGKTAGSGGSGATPSGGTGTTGSGGARAGSTGSGAGLTGNGGMGPGGALGGAAAGGSSGTAKDGSAGGRIDAGSGGSTSVGGMSGSGGATGGGPGGRGGATTVGGSTSAGGAAGGGTTGGGGSIPSLSGHYQMENLDRGTVAVKVSGGVYVGWRMLGYEYDTTASNVSYNLYRDGTKIATVTDSTNYLDASGTTSSKYTVSPVIKDTEGAQSSPVGVWAQQYLRIPLQVPATGSNGGTYSANDASTGDLDGDGKLDIVLKWDPSNAKDSSQSGATDPCLIDGYTLDGKYLWRINVGKNIRAGAHDTQFSVYDFDGDGKAEIALKTAPGTKDGTGAYLKTGPAAGADNTKDYRGSNGMALGGPEWFTVFDGKTGAELATVDYPVPYGGANWGDPDPDQANRSHRYNGGVSFVSDTSTGKSASGRPSIITQRGYYTRMTITAFNWRSSSLTKVWTFDSNKSGNSAAAGQGCHSLMTADVDGDGAMELIPGASTINSDGTFRCSTNMGHGDALHVGILIKGKGIQVFMPHEGTGGSDSHDASTCAFNYKITGGDDNGRGVADWVGTSSASSASCSSSKDGNLFCGDGSSGASSAGSNFLIYWSADTVRSPLDGTALPGVSTSGTSSCNGTKNTPTLTADLLGDWREELVARETDNSALRIYTTTNLTKRRIYTLMHDPTYRMQVSFEQTSYNQPPHPGFMIGPGMPDPPKPDIHVK
jgi:rhamnogalacturonan endolyase